MSDVMKLREFIKTLDKYIKEYTDNPNKRLDVDDVFNLSDLAHEAGQADTSNRLDRLGHQYDYNNINKEELLDGIREIGEEYDV